MEISKPNYMDKLIDAIYKAKQAMTVLRMERNTYFEHTTLDQDMQSWFCANYEEIGTLQEIIIDAVHEIQSCLDYVFKNLSAQERQIAINEYSVA